MITTVNEKEDSLVLSLKDLQKEKLYRVTKSIFDVGVGDIVLKTGDVDFPLVCVFVAECTEDGILYCREVAEKLEFAPFHGTITLTEE